MLFYTDTTGFDITFYLRWFGFQTQGKMGFGGQTPTVFFHKSFRIAIVNNLELFPGLTSFLLCLSLKYEN